MERPIVITLATTYPLHGTEAKARILLWNGLDETASRT
jgi:hypothetical protein